MLLDMVKVIGAKAVPAGQVKTLAIDTADWAEMLCVRDICARRKWDGIEDAGYGKGYTYLEEEFGRLLNLLAAGRGRRVQRCARGPCADAQVRAAGRIRRL